MADAPTPAPTPAPKPAATPKPKPRGIRRVLRWIRRAGVVMVVVALLAVGFGFVLLNTDWGREVVRGRLESALKDAFPGGAKIGRIEGSVLSTMTVFDIELDGRDGKPMVKIAALTIDAALRPLASKHVRVDSLVLDGLVVDLHPQPPDLTPPVPPAAAPGEPLAWSFELGSLELHDARITYTPATGAPIHVDGVELAASGGMPAPEDGARVAPPIAGALWVHGTWRERGPFALAANATYDRARQRATVPLLAASLAGASALGVGLRGDHGTTPTLAGALAIHAPRALLAAFAVPVDDVLPGGGDIDATLDIAPLVAHPAPGAKLADASLVQLALWATGGAAHVHAMIAADLGAQLARGVIIADDADLSALSKQQVRGHAEIVAALEATPTNLHGVVTATTALDVAPPTRMMLSVDASRDKLFVTAGAAGVDDARVWGLAEVQRVGASYTLTRGRLGVRARDPSRASQGRAPVHGEVWLDARARGPLWPATKLLVDADGGAADLRYTTSGAKTVKLHVSASNVPLRSDAYATLDVGGAYSGGAAIASASFDLHALAVPGEPVRVELTKHTVRTLAGIVFAGGGGRVAITPTRIDVVDLATGVGASKITASGTFAPKTADFSAQLAITDVGLASLLPELAGSAGGSIAIARRGGRWSGGGDLSARGLVAQPGRPPVDADVHVDIAGTHITAHATATNAAIFDASADLDVDGPRDLIDLPAWQRLPRRAIHDARVELTRFDVDAAMAAAATDLPQLASSPVHGGGVTGEIAIGETAVTGEFAIRGVTAPSGNVDAQIQLVPGAAGELATTVTVTGEGVGAVSATAHAELPAHLFARAEWAALDRSALRGASVTLADQPFDAALFARFGLVLPYHGHAAVTLTTTDRAATTTLAADVRDVSGGPIALPVAVHAGATLDGNGLAADSEATAAGTTLVAVRAYAPVTLDRLIAVGANAARFAPLTGDVTIATLKLPAALAIVDRHDITGGELAGEIELGGVIGTPTAAGKLAATAVTVTAGLAGRTLPRLDDLTIDLRWGGVAGEVDAVAHESNGGLLTLHGAGGIADPGAATLDLVAKKLDLAPLAAFAPDPLNASAGTLDADLHLRGLTRTGVLTGKLVLAGGRIPLAAKVGTLRKLDATVDVVGPKLTIKADGLLGPGDVHATGTVALAGASAQDADLHVVLHKVSPIGAVQPVIDANVDAKLLHADGKWTGKLAVTHADVNLPSTSSGHKLLPMGEPTDMEFVDAPPPPLKAIHLDAPADPWLVVSVDVAPTDVVADEIHATVKASDLKLSYGDELGLDGDIDMDRGDIELFGRRYQVELALLVFDGGTDPELNVSISYAFPDVTTYTDVSGRLSEPVLNLHADPALYTQGQLLGFLLGGDPGGDPSSQARDEAATVGASVASAYLSQKLNKVLPVKLAVRCNPSTSSSSAVCTAGKWVNRKLYVGYQQHLDPLPDENTGELDLEYYLLSRVVIDLSGGDRNDGIDLLWRKRW